MGDIVKLLANNGHYEENNDFGFEATDFNSEIHT